MHPNDIINICGFPLISIAQIATSLFLAILFLQSGLDKVFNWQGNKEWLTGHFSNSPLKGMVGFMLVTITIAEVLAGAISGIGTFFLIAGGSSVYAVYGVILSSLSLIALFFGQRMAQDYAGAGGLVPYFIVTLIGLCLFSIPL